MVKKPLAMQGTRVWPVVRELRSHKPRGNKVRAPQLLRLLALEPRCHNQSIQVPQGKIPGAATESQCSQINNKNELFLPQRKGASKPSCSSLTS